jgi:hypothetical protein
MRGVVSPGFAALYPGYGFEICVHQFGLIPAAFATLPHLSISLWI